MEEQPPSLQFTNTQNPKHVSPYFNFSDPNNPYRIENGDHTSLVLVTELLTTENYITWSRSMRRALRARNKLGFISGNIVRPTNEEDPLFEMWERCNDMVVSWIQNAVSTDIKHTLAFVDDAQMVWTELKDRLSQQNGPRIFQLRRDLATLRQDRDSAGNAEPPVCSHCNVSGHMVEKCYKLHGYPPSHKLYKGRVASSFANQAVLSTSPNKEEVSEEKMVFTKEQYHHLMSLIQPQSLLTATPTANPTSFNSKNSATPSKMSGATDHMVCSQSFFTSDITKVSYRDLSTWTTIGIAEVRSGLYHLLSKAVPPSSLTDLLSCLSPNFPSIAISVKSSMDVNGLWHCRLGHISDSRMKLINDPIYSPCPDPSSDFPCSPPNVDSPPTSPNISSSSSRPAITPQDVNLDNSYVSYDHIDYDTPSPSQTLRKSTRNRTAPTYLQDCQQAALTLDFQSMAHTDVTVKLFSGKRTKKEHKAEQNNIELSINGAFSTSRTGIYSLIPGAKTEP
ncbi:hypothetical protein POTOM_036782 [Populus tomentosa]|uniref:Retrotransposon Copia-like N-terminal domain-containing protein n=1 Tax=Populus tomentosa TaxID=118781 RepID=A0A8X7Z1C7_POPTO|nr:hypothetical protein POTOM_036782 [Populus tomentosa]